MNGEAVLKRQIRILRESSVDDIWVVVGQETETFNPENLNAISSILGNPSRIIVNPVNTSTQSTYSLYLGLQQSGETESVLVLDGDLVFEPSVIQSLITMDKTAIVTQQTKAKGSRVLIEKQNGSYLVKRIGEEVLSNDVYSGIMFLDKQDIPSFSELLIHYKDKIMAFAINDFCDKAQLYCIRLISDDGSLEIRGMAGGSFSRTTQMVKMGKQIVRKETISPGEQKLKDEITWLQNLPPDVAKHFPKITDYHINDKETYFEMPYYALPTLRTLLLDGVVNGERALEILKNVFDFLFSEIYSRNIMPVPANFIRDTHFKKTYERLLELQFTVPLLRDLIRAPSLVVNGKRYSNVLNIIDTINSNQTFIDSISPRKLSMIHGDLHFDNILIDLDADNFILIDPRGYHASDVAYDLGKIWHSCHGLYDFVHTKRFSFSTEGTSIEYQINDDPVRKEYAKILEQLPEMLDSYEAMKEDTNWLQRTRFSEAMHFCSVIPFQLGHDDSQSVAVVCYAIGVQLLNEIYNEWLVQEGITRGNVVNINTPDDITRASQIS